MRAIFTLTLFLGSALLFLVQPMVAKMILPRFGGSPGVWNASMLFFQAVLLLGYAYAHFSTKWLGTRKQSILHLVLLLVPLLVLPLSVPAGYAPNPNANPAPLVVGLLAVVVGLPFFIVSAGAPLLQRWFATTDDKDAKDPYFLYSASNLASLLALLAYPIVLEPTFRLAQQSSFWSAGYIALIPLYAVCAFLLWRRRSAVEQTAEAASPPPAWRERLNWVLLAFIPSSLLLGVTTYITSNIAPVPLLWVIPLTLYLITFIVAFARKTFLPVPFLARMLALLVTPLTLAVVLESFLVPLAVLHLLTFYVAAQMCHSELVRRRPDASHLTEFYLWMSLGGMLGGVFNGLLAPTLFDSLAEYPLAIVLACLVRPAAEPKPRSWLDYAIPAAIAVGTAIIVLSVKATGMPPSPARTLLMIGLPVVIAFLLADRPVRFALAIGGIILATGFFAASTQGTVLESDRSFFGVHRVLRTDNRRFHELVHGNTVHGMQDVQNPREPLTYYHRTGPIGQVFESYGDRLKSVGLVGLGVGSLAAYGRPGQEMVFFEIDPVVVDIARNPDFFTYLRDSAAEPQVVLGDGRITLQAQPDQKFNLIVLDAFSSDSIPAHLLTVEAVQLYLRKLAPDGVIAFHISNRYLNLEPVLTAIGAELNLQVRSQTDGPTEEEKDDGKRASVWVVMARDEASLEPLQRNVSWSKPDAAPSFKPWRDDYYNILSVFEREALGVGE